MADNYTPTSLIEIQHGLLNNLNKLNVSTTTTLLDIKHNGAKNSIYETEYATSNATATYNTTTGQSVILALTSALNTNKIIRQTREYLIYQQGKPLIIFIDAVINANSNNSNSKSRIGYFDDDNGVFFEHRGNGTTGGDLYVVRRFNGTDTSVLRTSFNIDQLDGMAPYEYEIDLSTIHTFIIEISWNVVRLGIMINDKIGYVHEFYNQDNELLLYTANLPIRYSIDASGSVSTARLIHYSTYVISEIDYKPVTRIYALNNLSSSIKINATVEKPVLIIRHKDFETNKGKIKPLVLNILNSFTTPVIFKIYKYKSPGAIPVNGITNSSFTTNSATEITEYAYDGTYFDTAYNSYRILLHQGVFKENVEYDFNKVYKNDSIIDLSGDLSFNTDYLIVSCQLNYGDNSRSVSLLLTWNEFL